MNAPDIPRVLSASAQRLAEISAGVTDARARADLDRIARMLQTLGPRLDIAVDDRLRTMADLDRVLRSRGAISPLPDEIALLVADDASIERLRAVSLQQMLDDLLARVLALADDRPAHPDPAVRDAVIAAVAADRWVTET